MNRRQFALLSTAFAATALGTAPAVAQVRNSLMQLANSGALPDFIHPSLFGGTEFDVTLGRGTMSLATALSEIYFAIDDRESAEQLRLVSTALIGDYDGDDLSNVQSVIDSKSDIDIASMQIASSEEAGAHMNRATLYSGLGIAYNAIAIDQAAEYANRTADAVGNRGGLMGRVTAGAGLLRDRRLIALATAATRTLPGNARLAQQIYSGSREYMRSNDLTPPTSEDVDVALAAW